MGVRRWKIEDARWKIKNRKYKAAGGRWNTKDS
jgi:hypothetical protein